MCAIVATRARNGARAGVRVIRHFCETPTLCSARSGAREDQQCLLRAGMLIRP